ncbi:MAG: hypothetical protein J1F02_07915 [Lachnospiraceae bacterium]|nr:hypothetical protein [Lachnospiraceae bacterium]
MFCTEFIFDGISSKEYDLLICSFDGNKSGSATAGSNIEFITFKAPNSNKWVRTGSNYNEQLIFTFQVCKYNCNSAENKPLSERELAFIMRWLVRKEYKYLRFIQEGYENIYYNCQINAEKYEIAGQCYGLTLTVTCDAPFGWSEPMHAAISSSTTSTIKLYDSSDEIGITFPTIEILSKSGTPKSPQDITIYNDMTEVEMLIKNCVANEHIMIRDRMIESSEYTDKHSTLSDDFNWKWLSIGNTFDNRVNEITVTGNCNIDLYWRVPRKAVI